MERSSSTSRRCSPIRQGTAYGATKRQYSRTYVMVGHSLGGFVVRIFANDYASEVAGIVLIDSMNPKQVSQSLSHSQAQQSSFQALLARFGIVRLLVKRSE